MTGTTKNGRRVLVQLPLGRQIFVKVMLESTIWEVCMQVNEDCRGSVVGNHHVELNGQYFPFETKLLDLRHHFPWNFKLIPAIQTM